MSSLLVIGPRRKYFDLVAQQNDVELLIKSIEQREKVILALKILAGIVVAVVIFWSIRSSFDLEGQRMDSEIQSWRAQGYPVPN
jgi:predicted membrane protein